MQVVYQALISVNKRLFGFLLRLTQGILTMLIQVFAKKKTETETVKSKD